MTGDDDVQLTKSDLAKMVPAARCRGCGCVTWKMSIAGGHKKLEHPQHAAGCARPMGRLDLLVKVPPGQRATALGGRLQKTMTANQIAAAAKAAEEK